MPIYLPVPQYDHNGPDKKGWNRIAIHASMTMDECAIKPKTIASFFDSLDTRKARYGAFGYCILDGDCNNCKDINIKKEWHWFGNEITVRVDQKGKPWVMNRPDNGWDEYGVKTTWIYLLQLENVDYIRARDKFSDCIICTKTA